MSQMDRFNAAVAYVSSLPKDGDVKPSLDERLKMYSYYKQVMVGKCSEHGGAQPWAVQLENRSKWDAWNALGDMSTQDAMQGYIDLLTSINKDWESE